MDGWMDGRGEGDGGTNAAEEADGLLLIDTKPKIRDNQARVIVTQTAYNHPLPE